MSNRIKRMALMMGREVEEIARGASSPVRDFDVIYRGRAIRTSTLPNDRAYRVYNDNKEYFDVQAGETFLSALIKHQVRQGDFGLYDWSQDFNVFRAGDKK